MQESSSSSRSSLDKSPEVKDTKSSVKGANGDKPQTTTSSAFASSGFAKLAASSTSPFGALGSGKPSLFGSSSGSSGSFSVLGGPKPTAPSAPKLTFGGSSSSSASPFALNGAKPSVFGGSAFGGSFGGSALAGTRLSTFGKPGEPLKSDKPARAFGAPESDGEDDSDKGDDDDESKGGEAGSDKDEGKKTDKDESKALTEEKKRIRLQKSKFLLWNTPLQAMIN